jgi:hypothetical protein
MTLSEGVDRDIVVSELVILCTMHLPCPRIGCSCVLGTSARQSQDKDRKYLERENTKKREQEWLFGYTVGMTVAQNQEASKQRYIG